MYINPYVTILLYMDGIAVCEDDFGDLWISEMPEEYAVPGDVLETAGLSPFSALSAQEQQRIRTELDALPVNYLDCLRDGSEVK